MARTPQRRTAPRSNQTQAAPAARVTSEMTQDMRDYRLWKLEQDVPVKTQGDFESEDAYREYLLNTYTTLRQQEYEYTVRNETLKVYNLAMDGYSTLRVKDNRLVWNGYAAYINQPGISADEKARRQQQVDDCAMGRAANMASICMNNGRSIVSPSDNLHCCAITATSVGAQICGEMGYDHEENIFQTVYRGTRGVRSNIASAREYCATDSVARARVEVYSNMTPAQIRQETKISPQKSLNELIASGEIGVGDALALPTGSGATNSTSGAHAMVVAEVIRDGNDNPVAYTLQANNNHCFITIDVNDKRNNWGKKPVINRAETHTIIGKRIEQESADLRDLPIAELEARVVAARSHTEQVVNDLQGTEQYNAEKGYDKGQARQYVQQHAAAMGGQFAADRQEAAQAAQVTQAENASAGAIGAGEGVSQAPRDVRVTESVQTASGGARAMSYTPEERADVYNTFAQCNDLSWQQLVAAYQQVDSQTPLFEFMRDGTFKFAAPSGSFLIDGLTGQSENKVDLGALMYGDKTAADDMFAPLLTALTEKDDKGLNDSMKLALGMFTEFLGGVEKGSDNSVPSLSDFMAYLADNQESAPENEQRRETTRPSNMQPLIMAMLRERA